MRANHRIASAFTMATLPLTMIYPQIGLTQELESFAVIAGQSLTNTGPTTIVGNIAVSPGISFTGAGSVTQTGTTFIGDAVGVRIQNDLTTLYSYLAGRPTSSGGNLTGQDLGGKTLLPGVYNYDAGALLSAGQTLRFDAQGDPDAVFIVNIGSTLTVGSGASVILENGAQGGNVFYRIGSSATLNTSAEFFGQVVALTSITMNTAAKVHCGAVYARNGSVTLDTNTVEICVLDSGGFDEVVVPEEDEDVVVVPEEDEDVVVVPEEDEDVVVVPEEDEDVVVVPEEDEDVVVVPEEDEDVETAHFSDNAINLAGALSTFVAEGGTLPISLAILPATQSPEELAISLDQLSGQVSTGVAQIGMQSTASLIDVVTRSTSTQVIQLVNAPRDTGVPVGMVPDRKSDYQNKYTAPSVAAAPEITPVFLIAPRQNWNIWASGFGGRSVADGSTDTGARGRTIDTSGFTVGFDLLPDANSRLGVALAFDQGSLRLDGGAGSAESDGISAAVYGSRSFDRLYVEAVIAYGQQDITTDRTVTIAGVDRFSGNVTTKNVAGQIEAGYRMTHFTPFVALQGQRVTTPAYAEKTTAGASTFALQYEEQTTESLRSELGVTFNLVESERVLVQLQTSWAHEFLEPSKTYASFQSVPGAEFATRGATSDQDSAIVALRGTYGFGTGFYATTDVTAEFSNNAQSYGGSVTMGYRW